MSASLPSSNHHPHKVSGFTASCVLMSSVIGSGIFTTTGFLARDLGDPGLILFLWILGALLALAGAMSYSELGAALPYAGGDYVYLREAYGPIVGFLSGWASFTVGFGAAIAAASVGFASYCLRIAPIVSDNSWGAKGLALLLLWCLTAVHTMGVGVGGGLQRTLTTTKVLLIVMFILGSVIVGEGEWSNLTSSHSTPNPHLGAFVVGLIFIMYTYLGWNVAGYIAGEIVDPNRNIPRIMIGGTAVVAVIYVFLNIVYFYALPVKELGQPPVLPVAEKVASALWGPLSGRLITIVLCVSIASTVSAMVWAGPRIYWAMARDGVFASFFSVLSNNSGVPVRSILLQSSWASLLILTGSFEQLVIYSGFVLTGFSALTVGALLVLRWRQPNLIRPFRVPFYPLVPGLFILVSLVIVSESLVHRPLESGLGLLTVLVGLPLYWLWRNQA